MKKQIRKHDLTQLFFGLVIIVLVNIISSFKFERFDLTSEKRYTLSDATKNLVRDLDDVVFIRIYLEGEFPAGFVRLRNAAKEMLDELRIYAGDNIEYEFINPAEGHDPNNLSKIYKELTEQGLQPTNLKIKEEGGVSQKIIFPGAILTYKERDLPLQLLKSKMGAPSEVMLNNSVQVLEYEFANTIRKLTETYKPKIAFIKGHGELQDIHVADIARTLSEYYRIERVHINGMIKSLEGFKAIIIADPDSVFSEKDKFIIDRFIMNGGKVLWLINSVYASMDSLQRNILTYGITKQLNLDDQLFKYGVRINADLIQDVQAAMIPVNTAIVGNQPNWELVPWIFFPIVMPVESHPIVKNINAVKFQFVSSIDTVRANNVKKSILLSTSRYSRSLKAPVRITLSSINQLPDKEFFNTPFQPVAVLLEGQFESVFKNRIPPEIQENPDIDFKDKSKPTKMIVVSDGDVIRNDVQISNGQFYPLGMDKYTGQEFGNKDFMLNCIDYLLDESGLITVRAKEIKLRLLDRTRLATERTKWQLINTCGPIALVMIFGVVLNFSRRKKYQS